MLKRRILVVDDEQDIRSIIRSALAAQYEVVEAQDGLDALAKLELVEPDFVILDVMMPLMDGVETCKAIRRHPRYQSISVLFLSAMNTKDDLKKGYGAGANLYLTKPFEPSRLLRNVDLFFENDAPPPTKKKHSIGELEAMEKAGPKAVARAHVEAQRASAPAAKPAAATAPAPAAAAGRPRVLAIDDDPDILTIIRTMLATEYEVVTAPNGLNAIEKITSLQPDLILLDAMMPKMSGYQLCQSLRRNVRFARTPVLFISAKCTPRDREYAMRVGANDFIAKPFSGEDLLLHLKRMRQLPDFEVHQKTLTMEQIQELENMRAREFQERQDRLHRKQETELDKFLRENS